MIRARAGISYALAEAMDEGHCGLPADELHRAGGELAGDPGRDRGGGPRAGAGRRRRGGRHGRRAALACSWPGSTAPSRASPSGCSALAAGHAALARRSMPTRPSPGSSSKTGLILAASQREAVRLALRSKLLVITGGPGVGKTTLVNAILEHPAGQDQGHRPGGTDRPGGQAAARGHRARGQDHPPPARGRSRAAAASSATRSTRWTCDLLVVDEISMVDVPLLHSLLKAVPPRAALILVGDVDQLPSVGPGQVLADIIASGAVPVVRLTEVFRQAAQSRIVTNAHRINQGLMPEPGNAPGSDFHLVRCEEPEDGARQAAGGRRQAHPGPVRARSRSATCRCCAR